MSDIVPVTQAKPRHETPILTGSEEAAFWACVAKGENCWTWQGAKSGNATHKYGDFYVQGKNYRAHRLSYVLSGRSLNLGEVIDHLCRNPLCVRPSHLEAVTPLENTLRGKSYPSHCKRGHPLNTQNGRSRNSGAQRACRQCGNLRTARWRARKAENSNG